MGSSRLIPIALKDITASGKQQILKYLHAAVLKGMRIILTCRIFSMYISRLIPSWWRLSRWTFFAGRSRPSPVPAVSETRAHEHQ